MPVIDVIIPAYNEEKAIGLVIDEIPKNLVRNILVGNNNSKDGTRQVAAAHGAWMSPGLVMDMPVSNAWTISAS